MFHFLLASRIGYVPPTVTGVDLIESFMFDGTFSVVVVGGDVRLPLSGSERLRKGGGVIK